MDKIRKMSLNYIRQGLYVSAALFMLTLLVMQVWFLDLLAPAIVSVAFTLVVCFTIGLVWRYIAKNSPDNLPTFFTAVSGFRLLLALAVMFVYYLLNKETMLSFFIVFMVFYVASLAHHSFFFARVSNK
jgi:hypothetical protein